MPFDFDAYIEGLDDVLPRFDVPLYRVNNEARIADLNEQIKAAGDAEPADDRMASRGPSALIAERDRLKAEQEASATMFELRGLSAQEFTDVSDKSKDLFDQLALQSQGTRNEAPREVWEKLKAKSLPGSWFTFTARANEIIERTLVMPDFSLSDSQNPSPPKPSES